MKKQILLYLFIVLTFIQVDAQTCLPEGISFSNQAEVNSFPQDYPGCITVLGNIAISNSSILNLDSLIYIQEIGGDLSVYYGSPIEGLDGLNNLYHIGGDLNIIETTSLENLTGLEGLTQVDGLLRITQNEALINLEGLNNLDTILTGNLQIGNNAQLISLDGLNNLKFASGLRLYNNESLQNINGLESLEKVPWVFEIRNNTVLVNLIGLNNLDSIGYGNDYMDSIIEYNDSLNSLTGLENLSYVNELRINNNYSLESIVEFSPQFEINRLFQIYQNESLLSLDGLEQINYLRGINITNNPNLENINGLQGLDSLGDYGLIIDSCNSLIDLNGLESIIQLPGDLEISNCETLNNISSLSGISNLERLYLRNCPSLQSLNGLQNLSFVPFLVLDNLDALTNLNGLNSLDSAYGVYIQDNDNLITLEGLENLKKVVDLNIGNFDLENTGNINLESLNGLNNLESIGNFELVENASLIDIDELENVETLDGFFRIKENASLLNINGLRNVLNIGNGSSLYISGNPLLSNCDIELVCGQLYSGIIENNAVGCESGDEMNLACEAYCYYDDFVITNQAYLNDFTEYYSDCQIIAGNLDISGYGIFDLSNLLNIVEVRGSIKIHDCPSLTNLDGLDNISSIYKYIKIDNNEILTSIDGLNGINPNSIDSLIIIDNSVLSNCSIDAFCDYYLTPSSVVTIENNNSGCNSIIEFEEECFGLVQNLVFSTQDEIDSYLDNCVNCDIINGNVTIEGNDITNLDGLSGIEFIVGFLDIGGVSGNPLLTSISGLSSLSLVNQELVINNNPSLSTLDGIIESESSLQLSSLESVGGNLEITNNSSLVNLEGLEFLSSIGGELIIAGNDLLVSLSGIDNIDPTSISALFISDNPLLSQCSVLSICNALNETPMQVDIYNNTEGCNNEVEVDVNCAGVGFEELLGKEAIIFYPNPATTELFISGVSSVEEIFIYNQLGQKVFAEKAYEGSIDISMINSGVYILEIVSNGVSYKEKLIIQ